MLEAMAMMSGFQRVYLVAMVLMLYPAWRRQRYALLWMWASMLAMFAVCLAMDLGLFGETAEANKLNSYLWMMIVDLTTGVIMVLRAGLSRVIAAGYAVTVPLYIMMFSGLFTRAEDAFTVINVMATLQVLVLCLGSLDNHSGGGGRRRAFVRLPLALPGRGAPVSGGPISPAIAEGQEVK